MLMLVGLTDECPTEEHIELLKYIGPHVLQDEQGNTIAFDSIEAIEEWAADSFDIWTLKQI